MPKKIALGTCFALGMIATASAQHATNSRRTPVSLESLGGVAEPAVEDLEWTNDYPANVRPILAEWMKYNGACRGGPGGRVNEANLEEWMSRVCSARDATVGDRTCLTAAARPSSAFSLLRARKVTLGTAWVKRAALP